MNTTQAVWLNTIKALVTGIWLKTDNFYATALNLVDHHIPETVMPLTRFGFSHVASHLSLVFAAFGGVVIQGGDFEERKRALTGFFVKNLLSLFTLYSAWSSRLTSKTFSIWALTLEGAFLVLNGVHGFGVTSEDEDDDTLHD
eukprot:TRINITY_DN3213_c0_g1_i1.p1 TRINITY_DN3213_c0_g1~~TRINITY_DN3213_c0_g1_i1.p1  ORF type:complete len:143 (+),score=23.59 TRINITY_DN3213_c0_g1_i1:89-517(+)